MGKRSSDIYVFDNREVNVLPTIKEWLKENDIKITLPDHVTDTYSFMDWFYDSENSLEGLLRFLCQPSIQGAVIRMSVTIYLTDHNGRKVAFFYRIDSERYNTAVQTSYGLVVRHHEYQWRLSQQRRSISKRSKLKQLNH